MFLRIGSRLLESRRFASEYQYAAERRKALLGVAAGVPSAFRRFNALGPQCKWNRARLLVDDMDRCFPQRAVDPLTGTPTQRFQSRE